MSSIDEVLAKMREERAAKQKARIERLREINLKKYSKLGNPATNVATSSQTHQILKTVKNTVPTTSKAINKINDLRHSQSAPINKPLSVAGCSKAKSSTICNKNATQLPKVHTSTNNSVEVVNDTTNEPSTHVNESQDKDNAKNNVEITQNVSKQSGSQATKNDKPSQVAPGHSKIKIFNKFMMNVKKDNVNKNVKKDAVTQNGNQIVKNDNITQKILIKQDVSVKHSQGAKVSNTRKSIAFPLNKTNKLVLSRKSMLPTMSHESVFDRLYKPKPAPKKELNEVEKLKFDPNPLKKVIKDAGMIANNKAVIDTKEKQHIRRSISAVHFKRLSRSEIGNCIHKYASIGDKIDKVHIENVSEDNAVKEDKVVLAVKSERKRVKFQTPCHNFNTPRPQELQARLRSWLQRRGKSLDSYQHLQCFGLNHLSIKPLNLEFSNEDTKTCDEIVESDKVMNFNGEDEDKENVALESDSDDESYSENMNSVPSMRNCPLKPDAPLPSSGWRTTSQISDSVDFNDTINTTITSADTASNMDEILLGALNDLTELLKEGLEWEQCARWLRALRERFPHVPNMAAYWECRAQLEERRGDLPASVQCWEEAIVKGTQHSVVEASLDQLLDKFMQLKISPNSGKRKQVDPKMLDVKNVFKSTIIRFAVQQAKIRQSEGPKYTVTPVRRSARLSGHWSGKRTPLQVCTSVRQADEFVGQKLLFVPNDTLYETP